MPPGPAGCGPHWRGTGPGWPRGPSASRGPPAWRTAARTSLGPGPGGPPAGSFPSLATAAGWGSPIGSGTRFSQSFSSWGATPLAKMWGGTDPTTTERLKPQERRPVWQRGGGIHTCAAAQLHNGLVVPVAQREVGGVLEEVCHHQGGVPDTAAGPWKVTQQGENKNYNSRETMIQLTRRSITNVAQQQQKNKNSAVHAHHSPCTPDPPPHSHRRHAPSTSTVPLGQ